MQEIATNIYVSTDYPQVNIGCVIGSTGVVAVDVPTLPQDALAWRDQIVELTGRPIVYTVLTDAHPHRLLSAALLGAPIVASQGAYEQAAGYSRGFWRNVIRRLKREYPGQEEALEAVEAELPRLLLRETLILHKGGADVVLERIAGAAPGSSWIKVADGDLMFLGDTLVVEQPPVMDECPDSKAWLDTLTLLRRPQFSDVTLVPGRGPISDQSATKPLSEYVRLARRRVRSIHRREGARDDVVEFVDELLSTYALSDEERSRFRRRVRNGLKRIYDELAPDEDSE